MTTAARRTRTRRPPAAAAPAAPAATEPAASPAESSATWEQPEPPADAAAPAAADQSAFNAVDDSAPEPEPAEPEADPAADPEPKPPTWEDAVVAIARQLAHPRLGQTRLARLRRMDPEQPEEQLFWTLLALPTPPPAGARLEAKWGAIIQGLALMTPNQRRGQPQPPEGWWPSAHDPNLPAGQALFLGGEPRRQGTPFYGEQRLSLLLDAHGPRLQELYIQACRLLGGAGQAANCRQLARLILTDEYDPEGSRRIRQRIARDYYRQLGRSQPRPNLNEPTGEDRP